MTKRMNFAWLVLAFMTATAAGAQTLEATGFSLTPPSGVGTGQFTNGNGDAATFSTVDNEIDSWWGLGIKSPCCGNYSGYGIVFDARTGSVYTQGNVGIGTAVPLSALTLAGTNIVNPNTGPQVDYNGENLSFENLAVAKAIGDIKMVQPAGYYVDAGDMVFSTSYGSLSEKMRVTALGNVGIGTTAPSVPLEVNGNVKLTAGSGASITFQDGTIQATAWNGVLSGGDYAESVDVQGDRNSYEPGDVLVINPKVEGGFVRSSKAYSTAVMGIYSTKPGARGRRQGTDLSHMKDEIPMAMIGIVPTKVSAENGPIHPGDLLVTSSLPGYAMKGTDRNQMLGAVIGKALGHLDSGTGVIEVGVTLQ